ncbi:hypothetical protein XU18_3026 [Perkinsela sp. CCAP 1560/4]|nr:hypothetical protein XU18_3026 [Perkinsela sp. CCAP 1560/4]|eukprot:KNH06089.1 hypothetical protein XU18_3026 [Perkinsela sp. CCAP 1560/4]
MSGYRKSKRSHSDEGRRSRFKQQRYEWSDQLTGEGHFQVVLGADIDDRKRYKIIMYLGHGTFGKVVLAFDRVQRHLCAVKIIQNKRRYIEDARYEIRNMKLICREDPSDKAHCVRYLGEFDNYTGHLCILMSQHGPNLLKHISEKPIELHHVAEICFQLLETLDFMHRKLNFVHSDLKPENILSDRWKDNKKPFDSYRRPWEHWDSKVREKAARSSIFFIRLCDFGGCQRESRSSEGRSSIIQTRHYRAPEVVLRAGWHSPADMWSVGCIAFEIATGRLLYDTHNDQEHIAMMGKHIGFETFPYNAWKRVIPREQVEWFSRDGAFVWPPSLSQSTLSRKSYQESLDRVDAEKRIGSMLRDRLGSCPDLEDFVLRCLTWDPRKRLTAREGLDHRFLREAAAEFDRYRASIANTHTNGHNER